MVSRNFPLALLVCACLFMVACQQKATHQDTMTSTQGSVSLQRVAGKWLFINYWASWCGSCREEIPILNAFHQKHHHQDAVIWGVNFGESSSMSVANRTKMVGIKFPVLLAEPKHLIPKGDVQALPVTFVFTPEGHFYKRLVGPQTVASLLQIMKKKDTDPVQG